MLKPSRGIDPLLRRPFSVFEVIRDDDGAPVGHLDPQQAHRRRHPAAVRRRAGRTVGCLGPLGRPFDAVAPPAEAWMVAGGVGLAPFVTLASRLQQLGTPATLFYGARTAAELYYAELFEQLGVHVVLATEDGSRGARGRVTAPLATRSSASRRDRHQALRLRTDADDARGGAARRRHRRPCDVSLEQVMGCGMGGCYSCVVLDARRRAGAALRPLVHRRPGLRLTRIVWEALAH